MCLWVIKGGGMKLVKFQISDLIVCVSGYCDIVVGGNIWVSGILINF